MSLLTTDQLLILEYFGFKQIKGTIRDFEKDGIRIEIWKYSQYQHELKLYYLDTNAFLGSYLESELYFEISSMDDLIRALILEGQEFLKDLKERYELIRDLSDKRFQTEEAYNYLLKYPDTGSFSFYIARNWYETNYYRAPGKDNVYQQYENIYWALKIGGYLCFDEYLNKLIPDPVHNYNRLYAYSSENKDPIFEVRNDENFKTDFLKKYSLEEHISFIESLGY